MMSVRMVLAMNWRQLMWQSGQRTRQLYQMGGCALKAVRARKKHVLPPPSPKMCPVQYFDLKLRSDSSTSRVLRCTRTRLHFSYHPCMICAGFLFAHQHHYYDGGLTTTRTVL